MQKVQRDETSFSGTGFEEETLTLKDRYLGLQGHDPALLLLELVDLALFRVSAVTGSSPGLAGAGFVVVLGADVRVQVLVLAVLASAPGRVETFLICARPPFPPKLKKGIQPVPFVNSE